MTKPIKIAFADDHSTYRKALINFIEQVSDDIEFTHQADNGYLLVEKLKASEILPSICLLDINMPVMNGYKTVVQLKKTWPGIKVLAFSMHESDYAVLQMLRHGATGYILKNGDPNEVVQAIKSMHERGFYHSDLMERIALREGEMPEIKERELDFLKLCCNDISYTEIAGILNVSTRTVEWYRDNLFKKFGIKTRSGLALFAMQLGLVPINDIPTRIA